MLTKLKSNPFVAKLNYADLLFAGLKYGTLVLLLYGVSDWRPLLLLAWLLYAPAWGIFVIGFLCLPVVLVPTCYPLLQFVAMVLWLAMLTAQWWGPLLQ